MIRRRIVDALVRPLATGRAIAAGATAWPRRDAIVILGAPLTPGGEVSELLAERLAVGLALWRAGAAATVVVTGGLTRGARRAEAEAMAEVVRAAGIEPVVEARSRSTAANAAEVRALAPQLRTVWLATQRFHARRSAYLFARHGFDAVAVHAAGGLEAHELVRPARLAVREYAAWIRALVG
ncbi:MAG: YdcF family protein [Kofleriaceae bacterium]